MYKKIIQFKTAHKFNSVLGNDKIGNIILVKSNR